MWCIYCRLFFRLPFSLTYMLFDSALRRELGRSFSATLIVIVTIVMTMVLIRTLGQASGGSINPRDVLLLMGYLVLAYMPVVLSLSLLISVTSALSRMYRDSEMAVWFAAGQGLAHFLPPVVRFAWPVVLAVAGTSLVGLPWANQQIEELKFAYQSRSDLQRVTPGQFQENRDGSRVFFIDKNTPTDSEGRNIFILQRKADAEVLITAHAGRIASQDGHRYLMLDNGHQLTELRRQRDDTATGNTDSATATNTAAETNTAANTERKDEQAGETAGTAFTAASFAQYGVYISPDDHAAMQRLPVKARPALQLWEEAVTTADDSTDSDSSKQALIAQGQLSWRVGVALSACNVLLLGLLIAGGNPRAGKSLGMILAVCSFFVYYNFIGLGERWVAAGKYSALPYTVILHAGVALFALVWLYKRHTGFSWRSWLRRTISTNSAGSTGGAA